MKHSLSLTAVLLGSLSLAAFGQDGGAPTPPTPPKPPAPKTKTEGKTRTVTKQVIVEQEDDGPRTGVVIMQDGDGPPDVMFLDGDALDDLGLDLPPPPELLDGPPAGAKFRLSLDHDGQGFDFSFDGPPNPEQLKQLRERIKAHLKRAGIKGDIPLPAFPRLDPAKRAEWKKRAAARRAELLEKHQARIRAALLKELGVKDDEAAVIGPLLDKVLTERRALARKTAVARRALRKRTAATQDREAARKLVQGYRAQRERDAQPLKKAQEELRGLLTVGQEALLVGRGLLE